MPQKISQLTAGTPIDADSVPYVDSTGPTTKRFTLTTLKAFLKTYFDTLYGAALGYTPVPNTRTVAGHALTANVTVSASDVSLGSVTNDAQIKASDFPSVAVDAEIALFNSTTGKSIKRATGSGVAVVTSGVLSTVTAPTGTIVGTTDTQTLTNKRRTKRPGNTTSSATPTINTDNVDQYLLTAQTADITSFTTNLSGTPVEGDTLIISITGTAARAITWGTKFEASTVALPTTTVTTARLDVGFIWNTVSTKWRCVAVA